MKTKEFIKMLQDADPSGEAHIRMDGGIPTYAELKEGYWDGPYTYLNDKGDYVTSIKGNKVDIHCVDMDDYVETLFDITDPNNWEHIKSKIKFEFNMYCDSGKDRIEGILKQAKIFYDEWYEIETRHFKESEERAIKSGWSFFQNKLVDDKSIKFNNHYFYTWLIYDKDGKELYNSTPYHLEGVIYSNKFERLDNNNKKGYYEWKLK